MWTVLFYLAAILQGDVNASWDKETMCPKLCTCRLEHTNELPIQRFTRTNLAEYNKQMKPEVVVLENNDVVLDEEDFNEFDESSFVRSATCIVQTETSTEHLIDELPKDVQSVTLIQASDSGNKSIKFSYFNEFAELQTLELQSAQKLKRNVTSHFLCEVDSPLRQLRYLNLERVLLKNSDKHYGILENEINEEVATFEYVQKVEGDAHPLTFVRRGTNDKILPYKTYMQNRKQNDVAVFIGFTNLALLRIYDCELNIIDWEMFEGLTNLKYLILEMNKLRFIPDFAFYGTPNLRSLSLAWNNLLNIQITDLAGLLELEYLDLSHNNFSQLSELSLPPFPKLKLANFANNPITVVFPNTFEVMNTTDSLILGGLEEPLTLLTNSFTGLKLLKTLTLSQLNIPILKREVLVGMPSLKVLVMSGNITEIEFDAFSEVYSLETLILTNANISELSIDSFIGLNNLRVLDLSKNNLVTLSPGIFSDLKNIKELYLNDNKFESLPKDIFVGLYPRLIRLNDNPWECSCKMSSWKPMLVNKIKQKSIKPCDNRHDKGVGCNSEDTVFYKFVYDNRVAPKCATPKKFENWSVFHVMRKQYKCVEFKPKLKKRIRPRISKLKNLQDQLNNSTEKTSTESTENISTENLKAIKLSKLQRKLMRYNKLKKVHNGISVNSEIVENSGTNEESNDI